ncbi:hypothetical protein Tco_0132426, partial [Tanacetum coccineum]
AYIEDGVIFIAKSSVTFLAKRCKIPTKTTSHEEMAQPVQNINHSTFRLMFEREKLYGNNFNDWFRQLKLVLRVEKKMFVIEQPLPATPAADSEAQVARYQDIVFPHRPVKGANDLLE